MNQHFEWETGSGWANAHGQINKHTFRGSRSSSSNKLVRKAGDKWAPAHCPGIRDEQRCENVTTNGPCSPNVTFPVHAIPLPFLLHLLSVHFILVLSSSLHILFTQPFTARLFFYCHHHVFWHLFFSFHFTIKADDNINYELHWELMWCPFFSTLFPSHSREVIFVIWPFPLERLLNTCWRSVFLRQPPRQER